MIAESLSCNPRAAAQRLCVAAVLALAGAANAQLRATPLQDERAALQLANGAVQLDTSRAAFADRAKSVRAGTRFIVQLEGRDHRATLASLEAAGLSVSEYLTSSAWVVSAKNPAGVDRAAIASIDGLGGASEFQPELKRAEDLGFRDFTTPERAQQHRTGDLSVHVSHFADADADEVAATVAFIENTLGGEVINRGRIGQNLLLTATVSLAGVDRIAELDAVQHVEDTPEITFRNRSTSWVVQSNTLNFEPLYDNGLFGAGQIIGVIDGTFDPDHCSFRDDSVGNVPGPGHRKLVSVQGSLGSDFHGTHVAGTAAGDAGADNDTRGIAWQARLATHTYVVPFGDATWLGPRLDLHHSLDARVHTNSWGDDSTTSYTALSRAFDQWLWDNEESFLCLAATNTSTLKVPENAKNLLAVGGTENDPAQADFCTGGRGPTADGRRKPEVFAPGCDTFSANSSTSCGVSGASGTSMATPAVAGIATLCREYLTEGYYPGGIRGAGQPFTPSGALIKSMIVNSAVDMTGVSGYPSDQEGWGRVLADNVLFFPGDTRTLAVEQAFNADGLSTGQQHSTTITVLDSSEQLRVTMAFTDFPASINAGFVAVNNLDLEVISPTGAVYSGNDFAAGDSVPNGGNADAINNVEQVHVSNPAAGVWTVNINATEVAQGPQGWALTTTGAIEAGTPALAILAQGVPSLVAPGNEPGFAVEILETGDTLVPGTARVHYRYSPDDPFAIIDLENPTRAMFAATLPPVNCGDEPEFFVSAEGQNEGIRYLPSNALDGGTFSFEVGELVTDVALTHTFESGTFSDGWTADGLWNVSSTCSVGDPPCDGTSWAYYGDASNCNYDNGSTSGSLTSPPIDIPVGGAEMTFCSFLVTEALDQYDKAEVLVNGAVVLDVPESMGWSQVTVNLSDYAGQTVTIAFRFDTLDGIANNFLGWGVDGVEISATNLICEPVVTDPCPGDADGNGETNTADITLVVSNLGAGGPKAQGTPGDVDGDGITTTSDITLVVSNLGCSTTR
ncbi:MAG: S8 family serine peptidase [Planctomycetota bacterium]